MRFVACIHIKPMYPFVLNMGAYQDYFDATDEPSQQIPFMYHYADQPAKSTRRAREVVSQSFNTSLNGLPGNDGKSPCS